MLTFIIVLLGLSLLILGHEAGHFFAAKLFDLRVDEFGIGFPPRAKAWRKGETEYSVNWLPFGGFVKIAGENDHMDEESRKEMAAATQDGAGDAEPAASVEPEDKSRYFFTRPAWQRAIVMAAGVIVNFVAGWILISIVFMIGTNPLLAIQGVSADSPAAAAGLEAGDVVKEYEHAADFIAFIEAHPEEEVQFTVVRGVGEEVPITVEPRAEDGVGRIGVALAEGGAERQGFFEALKSGFIVSGRIAWLTVQAFYLLVQNLVTQGSLLEGIVGPVGIFTVAEETSQFGLIYLLQLLGFISVNLAVANLIPFPALDGGRLLFLLVEKIKGSPISRKVELWANGIGFALLIGLMVLVTIRDVAQWF